MRLCGRNAWLISSVSRFLNEGVDVVRDEESNGIESINADK
jgi:hypothetical protein